MSFNPITQVFVEQASAPVKCWCGTEFVVGKSLYEFWIDRGGNWSMHCPLGHTFVPGRTSEASKLRDELAREKHKLEQSRAHAEHLTRRVEAKARQVAAARGQVTKIKNRVKNGVCPACSRTFENLARHMASKHPHYCEAEKA
jgi:hypothetical protein